ncbi:ABC transporter ATP-binding protein [Nonomuraea sp. NPDC050451]|uniref:ABC transporter ATP-binding protein n=1 Tax=Nonomuraea sp. NPDC050451 TaxID=3364364 RepID=UPI0037A0C5F5
MMIRSALMGGRLVWKSAPALLWAYLAVTLLAGVVPIVVAWLTKLALDRIVSPGPPLVLLGLAAGLAVAGLFTSVSLQSSQYLRAEAGRRSTLVATDELFAAMERLDGLARFEDPAFLDRLRFAQESVRSLQFMADSCFGLVRGAITLVGFVGSLAVISPPFTGIVVVAAIPALWVQLRLSRKRVGVMWRIGPVERREMFYGQLLSTVNAAKEIRLLGLGPFLRGRMIKELRTANDARRRLERRELLYQSGLSLLAAAISGGGLIWAVTSAGRGLLSVGDVSMFTAAAAGVQGAIAGLVTTAVAAHHQLLMFGHYVEVVEAAPDLPPPARAVPLPDLRRGIEFKDVWFRYGPDHPWVLRGVNLFIPYGEAVALVGRNGSGKSTMVKLLCRFYDPTKGAILWDGVDLRDVEVGRLRERIGAVFQDFMSYDLSAADNIAVGDLAALGDRRRIETAGRHAGVHELIAALPRGYDTLLTRMFRQDPEQDDSGSGVPLSGGQWQRLALARAFLRRERDLMILDEPSAGLDAEAEHEIHTRLREIRAGRTGILISHRLGAVRDAGLIAVLEDGVIVEQGGHEELLGADGTYAQLFTLQATGYVTTA